MIGATPEISIRVEKKRAISTPSYRSRTTARAITMPAAPARPCSEAEADEEFGGGGEGADGGGEDIDDHAEQQRSAASPLVAHGPDHDLAERHARQAGGEGELDGGRGCVQRAGDLGQGREVHVHGERGQRGEPAEDQRDQQPGAARGDGSSGRGCRLGGGGCGDLLGRRLPLLRYPSRRPLRYLVPESAPAIRADAERLRSGGICPLRPWLVWPPSGIRISMSSNPYLCSQLDRTGRDLFMRQP